MQIDLFFSKNNTCLYNCLFYRKNIVRKATSIIKSKQNLKFDRVIINLSPSSVFRNPCILSNRVLSYPLSVVYRVDRLSCQKKTVF